MTVPAPTSPESFTTARTTPAWWTTDLTSTELRVRVALILRQTTLHPSGCILWTGSTGDHGYGHIGKLYVHRLMFSYTHRPLLDGEYVLHSCDVRRCVRPDHLSAGSHLDNIADARAKGRMRNDPSNGRFLPWTGAVA